MLGTVDGAVSPQVIRNDLKPMNANRFRARPAVGMTACVLTRAAVPTEARPARRGDRPERSTTPTAPP
jgi:hypothetical protein